MTVKNTSNKTIHINETDNYKIVAISDVHAHPKELKALVKKVNLKDEDYLIILGDFLNRGYDSLETFDYVKDLSKRKRTVVLKGNHESFMQRPIDDNDHLQEILEYFKRDPYETFIHKLALKSNFDLYACQDAEILRQHILDNFDEELEFLRQLPLILYFDDMVFVHGGIEPEFDIETDETAFLKYDYFDRDGSIQDKMTIVGHFPSCNLRVDYISNLPYFNFEKNIVTIDGGYGVRSTGELNAFIIEKKKGVRRYDCIQYSDFPKSQVTESYTFKEEDPVHLVWPNREIELIERGQGLSKCYNREADRYFSIFNGLIDEKDGAYKVKMDYANTFLSLPVGAEVSICSVFEDCVLVKHNKIFGWLWRHQLGKL